MKFSRILITPLDWGLGHATRCIPVIKHLIDQGCQVVIASSGTALTVLQNEFPTTPVEVLPAYNPLYSRQSMVLAMACQMPKFLNAIGQEHAVVKKLIKKYRINLVISDNRYGCWSSEVESIIITHQLTLIMPPSFRWIGRIINYFNTAQINKFSQCWVPDSSDHFLSGKLSINRLVLPRYIGPLSRLKEASGQLRKYDLVIVLSGPEPQRSYLESLLLAQLPSLMLKTLFIRGVVIDQAMPSVDTHFISIVNFLTTEEMQDALEQAEIVIARSGYSTIMDLARLVRKAIFIPTPGQTEQAYLAQRLMDKGIAYSTHQHLFDLRSALNESARYTGFEKNNSFKDDLLQQALDTVYH